MTDKPIIIDGVVSPITEKDIPNIIELHKSKSFVEIAKIYGVTQNAIRYWVKKYGIKPLKQKEQIEILAEQLARKEQECEELKEAIDGLLKIQYQLADSCTKYEQTLTEIKEITEKIDDSDGCAYGDYDCNNCSSLEQETVCTYKVKKLILQKIRECEAENEN